MAKYHPRCEQTIEEQESKLFIARWLLHKFNQRFPDEAACIKELNKRRTGSELTACCKCASTEIEKIDERKYLCLSCRRRSWFTSGTSFEGLKRVRPWFCASWLDEQGIKLNGHEFGDLIGISRSTGAYIIKRMANLSDNMKNETNTVSPPDNIIQCSEYSLAQEQHQDNDIETRLYAAISGTPQDVDTLVEKVGFDLPPVLSALMMLELANRVTRLAGDRYVRTEKARVNHPHPKKTIRRPDKKETGLPTLGSTIDSVISTWQQISKIIFHKIIQIANTACTSLGAARQTSSNQPKKI